MFGYMTEEEAKESGFTRHGKYCGIPIWICPENDFAMTTKWLPLRYVMEVLQYFEFVRFVMFPDYEPYEQFRIGKEIK